MTRRFCDLCDTEIDPSDRFYDVHVSVKRDASGDEPIAQESGEFCYPCTKSGKALVSMLDGYEKRLAATIAKQRQPEPTEGGPR